MTTRKHRVGSSPFPAACAEKSFTLREKPPTEGGPIGDVGNDIVANASDCLSEIVTVIKRLTVGDRVSVVRKEY